MPYRTDPELLDAIVGGIGDGLTVVDREGRVVFANDVAARLFGLESAERLMSLPFSEISGRYDVVDESGSPASHASSPARAFAGEEPPEMVLGWRRPGTKVTLRWTRTRSRPVRGADGSIHHVVNVIRDVTDQRRRNLEERFLSRASALLAESLDWDATISQVAKLLVPEIADWSTVHLVQDGTLRRAVVAHADPAKVRLADELDAKYPPDLSAPRGLAQVLRTGKPELYPAITEEMLAAAARSDEHGRILRELGLSSAVMAPLKNGGAMIGVLTLISSESGRHYDETDLAFATELARRIAMAIENAKLYREAHEGREASDRANREKDGFIAMLAHELRNPLAPLFNAAHLLSMPNAPAATQVRAREVIDRQLRHLARLVDDLLDVSRITRGKVELRREALDLSAIARDVQADHAPAFRNAGISLSIEAPEPVPIEGDRTRVAQIAGNLLSNAIKFTPAGGTVVVRVWRENGFAFLTVKDDGVGIAADRLKTVFDPFVQGERPLDRPRDGLGLGLSVVKSLAEMHGGAAWAASEGAGKGTVLTIRLPLSTPSVASIDTPVSAAKARVLRVLVIDDNVDLADTVRDLLGESGHDVSVLYSGDGALEEILRLKPDFVLCDLGLPVKDGYAIAREVRRDPTLSAVKLIAVSGYGMQTDKARALASGFDRHLTKPLDPRALIDELSR